MANTSNKIETAIALPFDIDAYGNVKRTYDQSKIWADRVRSVVGTLKKERVMEPKFGTKIPLNVFESESVAEENIRREIYVAFTQFLEPLTLDEVTVTFNDEDNVIYAEVIYSLPNKEQVTTSIGVATISGTKLISEERL